MSYWTTVSYLASLGLYFLIYKMGVKGALTSVIIGRIK